MKFNRLKILLLSVLSIFNIFFASNAAKEVSKKEAEKSNVVQTIVTFSPKDIIEALIEVLEEREIIDKYYKKVIEEIELEAAAINARKEKLNEEIKNKGAALDRKVVEEQYTDIVNAENALYQKQGAMEMGVRQSVMELTAKAKKLIDEGITEYIVNKPDAIIIATEYKENPKFSITLELADSINAKYKKSKESKKNVNDKKSAAGNDSKNEKSASSLDDVKSPVKAVKI